MKLITVEISASNHSRATRRALPVQASTRPETNTLALEQQADGERGADHLSPARPRFRPGGARDPQQEAGPIPDGRLPKTTPEAPDCARWNVHVMA